MLQHIILSTEPPPFKFLLNENEIQGVMTTLMVIITLGYLVHASHFF